MNTAMSPLVDSMAPKMAPRKPAIRTVAQMGLPAFSAQCFIEYLCWALWAWYQEQTDYAYQSVKMASVWARS